MHTFVIRVHLIRKETIEQYAVNNARSQPSFQEWLSKLEVADWNIANDIKSIFGSADLLGNSSNRVVFNIGGNNYRVICKYAFGSRQVHLFIYWMGTRTEYNALCSQNKQFTISVF